MKPPPPLILFDFDELSLSQRIALAWLAEHGGAAVIRDITRGASEYARHFGSLVSTQTIRALIRRDYLDVNRVGPVFGGWRVQFSSRAVGRACNHVTNPHPVPIMLARAEAAAHQEITESNR